MTNEEREWENDPDVEIEVRNEPPALTLRGSDYNDKGDDCPIYWSDLKTAPMGTEWAARCGNSWRDAIQQTATLVYRDMKIAVLCITTRRAADSPTGETSEEKKLRGFSLRKEAKDE